MGQSTQDVNTLSSDMLQLLSGSSEITWPIMGGNFAKMFLIVRKPPKDPLKDPPRSQLPWNSLKLSLGSTTFVSLSIQNAENITIFHWNITEMNKNLKSILFLFANKAPVSADSCHMTYSIWSTRSPCKMTNQTFLRWLTKLKWPKNASKLAFKQWGQLGQVPQPR